MADFYGVPELSLKCLEAFADLLTPECALEEMAQSYALLHEPIMGVIVAYLKAHWVSHTIFPYSGYC